MTSKGSLYLAGAATVIALVLAGMAIELGAQQLPAVAIDNDDIGGVVTGANGPEAGAWVVAETTDLSTRCAKMVVTDDQGRYVVPDLPKAKYKLWAHRSSILPIGRNVSKKASCRKANQPARKGSSAMSWSRPGIGTTRRNTCTT